MRIALLTDGIWPSVIGGMQKHSFYLCKYFARKGIYVELFHPAEDETEIDFSLWFSEEELHFIRPWFINKPYNDKLPGHYLRYSYQYSRCVFEKLKAVLQDQRGIDFIYSKGLAGWYLLKNRSLIENCPPIAVNVHGYEYFQKSASIKHKLEQYFLRPAFKYVNNKADFIFSYGGKISEIIRKRIVSSDSKIIEIPTGIESEFLVDNISSSGDKRDFVFIGRNERRKGVFELKKAIEELLENYDFSFHFIGDIPEQYRIDSPMITYHGVLKSQKSISAILQKADVLICPSYSEGMPNVIMEGMASGCGIIASNVGAVNIQVGPENGWLIEPGSVISLKNAMINALKIDNSGLTEKRRNSLRKIHEKFLWDKVIEQKIEAIKKIISND